MFIDNEHAKIMNTSNAKKRKLNIFSNLRNVKILFEFCFRCNCLEEHILIFYLYNTFVHSKECEAGMPIKFSLL